jgi:predicted Zn finger-like uncharacterized protein
MLVLCPACAAQYDVPDRLIGTGRRLRCARCDHDWMVRSPAPPPPPVFTAPPVAAPPLAAPVPAQAAPLAPWPRLRAGRAVSGLGLWLAWAASVGAVLLALAGLWLFQAELSVAWPPLQRLYGVLG